MRQQLILFDNVRIVPNSHVVVFRTGGAQNFAWHSSLAMSEQEAHETVSRVRKMGYAAHVEPVGLHDALGLPSTYQISVLRQMLWRTPMLDV